MLHSVAEKFADKILSSCQIDKSRKPIYVYGLELTFSTMSSILSILIFSFVMGIFPSALMFLLVFCPLRLVCGGYHASTYFRCFVVTNLAYLVLIGAGFGIEKFYCYEGIVLTLWILIFCSILIVFLFSPVKNKHHPLTEERYQRNAKAAKILAVLIAVLEVILFITEKTHAFIIVSITLTAVAVMMIIPKIKERRN